MTTQRKAVQKERTGDTQYKMMMTMTILIMQDISGYPRVCAPKHCIGQPLPTCESLQPMSLCMQRAEGMTQLHHTNSSSKHCQSARGEMWQDIPSDQGHQECFMHEPLADTLGSIGFTGHRAHRSRQGAGVEAREQSGFRGFWRIQLRLL